MIALLATAVLCLISYVVARQLVAPRGGDELSAILLPCTPDHRIVPLHDGVLFHDGTHLHALDDRGRQIWSQLAGTGSNFSVSDGGVAVWLGTKLTLFNAATGVPLFSQNLTGNILSAKLGTVYAAVQMGEERNNTIMVVGRDGSQVETVPMPNQTVLDYGFFNNGSLLWTLSLDTEGTVPKTTITTRRPGRMVTGSIEQTDQVLYRVCFQVSDVLVVGRNHLLTYDYQGKEIANRALVYGWLLMDVGGAPDSPLLAFAPDGQISGLPSISDVRMLRAGFDRTIRMPFPCFAIAAKGDRVFGFHRKYAMSCDMQGQPEARTLPFEADRSFGLTGQGAAILASGSSVYLVPLQ